MRHTLNFCVKASWLNHEHSRTFKMFPRRPMAKTMKVRKRRPRTAQLSRILPKKVHQWISGFSFLECGIPGETWSIWEICLKILFRRTGSSTVMIHWMAGLLCSALLSWRIQLYSLVHHLGKIQRQWKLQKCSHWQSLWLGFPKTLAFAREGKRFGPLDVWKQARWTLAPFASGNWSSEALCQWCFLDHDYHLRTLRFLCLFLVKKMSNPEVGGSTFRSRTFRIAFFLILVDSNNSDQSSCWLELSEMHHWLGLMLGLNMTLWRYYWTFIPASVLVWKFLHWISMVFICAHESPLRVAGFNKPLYIRLMTASENIIYIHIRIYIYNYIHIHIYTHTYATPPPKIYRFKSFF